MNPVVFLFRQLIYRNPYSHRQFRHFPVSVGHSYGAYHSLLDQLYRLALPPAYQERGAHFQTLVEYSSTLGLKNSHYYHG
jgi:hypothetical protein